MKYTMIVVMLMALVVCKTSDSTYMVNNGTSSEVVVVN